MARPSKAAALAYHPIADVFPLIQGDDYTRLVEDIRANGLLQPIILHEGKILDGRNRYRACIDLGIKPLLIPYAGTDPIGFSMSANLSRRHLNETQRSIVAAKLETLKHGGDRCVTDQDANLHLARKSAAALLLVSPRSVADARKVLDHATPALIARVESGEVAVSVASKLTGLSREQQDRLAVASSEAQLRNAAKKARRDQREIEQAEVTEAASRSLGSTLYGVIYADPPWRFEPRSRATGLDRAADNHYATMGIEDICAIDVPAADDAALFLWATVPMLPEALYVMNAWGFVYQSHFVWIKDRIGTGYWARNKHELLLIGTRGRIAAPAPGEQFESVVLQATERHSAKPAAFAEMIEQMFPTARLLEMFARTKRAGWDGWGNEYPPSARMGLAQ
jgi:N6-adenosine-specific RNA methylase IME4